MIFFDYYFKAHSTPKYLAPVAVCMERRYQALIADEATLKNFIAELKSELNSIPKAKGRYEVEVGEGFIYIYTKSKLGFADNVLRLNYKEVLKLEGFGINDIAEKGGTE